MPCVQLKNAYAVEPTQTFEAVAPMHKDDKAPFEGILLSKDLAARIEAEKKTMISLKLSEAQLKAESEIIGSEFQKKIDILTAEKQILQLTFDQMIKVKDDQLDFYRSSYEPEPWYKDTTFLICIGIVSGVGLTIGASYLVKSTQ